MLSVLLTAIVLFAALLGALHLRSAAALIGLLLAAAVFLLLVRRPLDGLALPGLHLVYEIDEQHALLPGPDLPARSADTVRSRLQRTGVGKANVQVVAPEGASPGSALDIVAPVGPGDEARLRAALEVVGLVEFVAVDDDHDFFEQFVDTRDVPGLRFERENAPLGVGKTRPVWYVFMPRAENEDMVRDTLPRLKAWADKLPVPSDNKISFEKVVRFDPERQVWEDEGWRTFYLHAKAEVTGNMIREAQARPDASKKVLGGWIVALEFTAEGARLFEEATERWIKRRFAIVLDGIVESAPIVQTRIGGGQGVITMGAGTLDEQEQNARKLEVVLRSGALPAPLRLRSEERIAPAVGSGTFTALIIAASLVLAAELGLGLWLAFRPRRAPAVPARTSAS